MHAWKVMHQKWSNHLSLCIMYIHCLFNYKKSVIPYLGLLYIFYYFAFIKNVHNTQYSSQSNYEEVVLSSRKSNTYFSCTLFSWSTKELSHATPETLNKSERRNGMIAIIKHLNNKNRSYYNYECFFSKYMRKNHQYTLY